MRHGRARLTVQMRNAEAERDIELSAWGTAGLPGVAVSGLVTAWTSTQSTLFFTNF